MTGKEEEKKEQEVAKIEYLTCSRKLCSAISWRPTEERAKKMTAKLLAVSLWPTTIPHTTRRSNI